MPAPRETTKRPYGQLHRRLFPRRLDRVLDILHGRELDIEELAVHLFDPAQVNVVNDIARPSAARSARPSMAVATSYRRYGGRSAV
jgi:hypothetical protein